jgi:hypothetical protein
LKRKLESSKIPDFSSSNKKFPNPLLPKAIIFY